MTNHVQEMQGATESLPRPFGRYLLLDLISRGGMGEIFLASHGLTGFEKLVVIKKIRKNLAQDKGFTSRFVEEAQLAVNLQHANIAQVFEVGRVANEFFLALEYVDGRVLRRTLNKLERIGGRLPPDLALFIARQVAGGLSYAHRRTDRHGDALDLVHCDVSPPNLVLSFEGEAKLIDFGIARSAHQAEATDPKIGWGKYGYMSPEQLLRGRKVDHRSDIYALGVVLFEMLTGKRMYPVSDKPDYKDLARKVTKGEHPVPSDFDAGLGSYDRLVIRALEPEREQRYQSAAELRDDIQRELVRLRPTLSTDDLGMFMRHLFAEERLAAKKRLAQMVSIGEEREWQSQLDAEPATVTFAMGEQFAAVQPLPAPAPQPAPGSGRLSWLIAVGLATLILVGAVVAIIVVARGAAETKAARPARGGQLQPGVAPVPVVRELPVPGIDAGAPAPGPSLISPN